MEKDDDSIKHVLDKTSSFADSQEAKRARGSSDLAKKGSTCPKEILSIAREKSLASFDISEESHTLDLDHLILSIKGILATNKEIWERCKRSKEKHVEAGTMRFQRVAYDSVKVESNINLSSMEKEMRFSAIIGVSIKAAGKPPPFSGIISKFINFDTKEDEGFPDFGLLFERSLLLHDDLLPLFLFKFREHLEKVQVYLGGIDSWLMEATTLHNFLEETFQKKIPSHTETDFRYYCDGEECTLTHFGGSLCQACRKCYRDHYISEFELFCFPIQKHNCSRDTEIQNSGRF